MPNRAASSRTERPEARQRLSIHEPMERKVHVAYVVDGAPFLLPKNHPSGFACASGGLARELRRSRRLRDDRFRRPSAGLSDGHDQTPDPQLRSDSVNIVGGKHGLKQLTGRAPAKIKQNDAVRSSEVESDTSSFHAHCNPK